MDSAFLETVLRVPMPGPTGVITYLETVEGPADADGFGTLSLVTRSQAVQSATYKIKSRIPTSTTQALQTVGIDATGEVVRVLQEDAKRGAEVRLKAQYAQRAGESAKELNMSTRWKRFLYGTLGIAPRVYVTNGTTFAYALMNMANMVGVRSRRGPATFAVISRQQRVALEESPAFIYAEKRGTANYSSIEYFGTLANLRIYVDHTNEWNDNVAIVGRKAGANEPGVYRTEYSIHLEEVAGTTDWSGEPEQLMALSERSATVTVGDSGYKSYLSADIRVGKRPLWRKILGV